MNEPSIVSNSDMPAANRIGRHRIAYQGSPAPAAPPARKSSDLGGRVEAQPEEDSERVHVPRLAHGAGRGQQFINRKIENGHAADPFLWAALL